MFAVIKTGGKQYKVAEGDVLMIEKLNTTSPEVTFSEILLIANEDAVNIGQPILKGASVIAKIIGQGKGDKKMVFKYKSKTRQRKKKGHRQQYTKVQITKISL
jgi:large subunit ribosomal protein L21